MCVEGEGGEEGGVGQAKRRVEDVCVCGGGGGLGKLRGEWKRCVGVWGGQAKRRMEEMCVCGGGGAS